MQSEKQPEPNVKLTAYVPPNVREKVETFGKETFRNLSQSVQFLLDTHPLLQTDPGLKASLGETSSVKVPEKTF